MNKRTLMTIFLAVVLTVATIAGVWRARAQGGDSVGLPMLPAANPYSPTSSEQETAALYQQVTPSLVNITVATRDGSQGTGSGFVIDTEGHIVTNNHVVEDAFYIEATFLDGTIVEASLVGRDPDADLAVILVDPTAVELHPIEFADSDQVFVGQQVYAIGNPFGQDFTLTTGIVSALDRSLLNADSFSIPKLIQTDAAINPGNSGGPLLDREGHVIGVNTAILSSSRTASGVGFAIPSNTVRRIVPYLIKNGEYNHTWLGITGSTLRPEQRSAMQVANEVRGVMVSETSRNAPAANAGLSGSTGIVTTPLGRMEIGGDIILSINDMPIGQMSDLIDYLEFNTQPGDLVTLVVLRDGTTMNVQVTLEARP